MTGHVHGIIVTAILETAMYLPIVMARQLIDTTVAAGAGPLKLTPTKPSVPKQQLIVSANIKDMAPLACPLPLVPASVKAFPVVLHV